jgi:dTDP-4-dehydrorhamnose 3,5-epimerase
LSIVITSLDVEGAALLTTPVFSDLRGDFEVFWEHDILASKGIRFTPINAHHSYNLKSGTIRAFHFQQAPHGQAKLVTCVSGAIWDVIVDLRKKSPTYLQWSATELKAGGGQSVYVPSGCAHGFVSLEDNSTVAYLIEGDYVPTASAVIRWNDPTLAVSWPVKDPILSDKDRNAPFFAP